MSDKKIKNKYRNRELSWLSFNERVLQEADNKEVPLLERLKFLSIYSNNLDEFFKVRVATLRRLAKLRKKSRKQLFQDPKEVIEEIKNLVSQQQHEFEKVYLGIKKNLREEGIIIVDETELSEEQRAFVLDFFVNKMQAKLFPIYLTQKTDLDCINDDEIALAIKLETIEKKYIYAMMNIPTESIDRFIILPKKDDKQYIILQDDVIRVGLPSIFELLDYKVIGAYTFKITRDAELDINDDLSDSYMRKIAKGLEKRKWGNAVRMVYDSEMPADIVNYFSERLNLNDLGSLVSGGRYHNFKHFMNFPNLGRNDLKYKTLPTIIHPELQPHKSVFDVISNKDIMLHFPYHSFSSLINFLREAAIDPKVKTIKMTLYRVAHNSSIMKALINAANNGKDVTAVLELRARFDEESNMHWSKKLDEAGVKVIFGVPGLKVHSKLVMIKRKEENQYVKYVGIGTGNFNESTANIFSDALLLTKHAEIAKDVKKVFNFFEKNYKVSSFKQLIVAPFYLRNELNKLIYNEIENAKANKKAEIHLKINNLSDHKIINLLYEAYEAGVKVKINVRGMFTLIPKPENRNVDLECICMIDRFLEHSRFFYFYADGEEKVYLSSADLMARNLDRRTEIMCPILSPEIKEEVMTMMNLQWEDNLSTRILDNELNNYYRKTDSEEKIRSQIEFHKYLKSKTKN